MGLPFAPFGFRPVRTNSGCIHFAAAQYSIASGLDTALRLGDPVKLTGTGTNITLAAGGDTATGIFNGAYWIGPDGVTPGHSQEWYANGTTLDATDAEAMVINDLSNVIFQIQADTFPKADVGLLFDWNVGTGNARYHTSGAYLDHAAGGATTGKGLLVLGLSEIQGNDWGAGAIVDVKFAEGTTLGITSGAGGVS
jgi:hypothetical protein